MAIRTRELRNEMIKLRDHLTIARCETHIFPSPEIEHYSKLSVPFVSAQYQRDYDDVD